MTNPSEKKRWNARELSAIFEKNAKELDIACAKHRVIGFDVNVDKATNQPYFTVVLQTAGKRKDRKTDISNIPSVVGEDKIPVKVAFKNIPKAL